MYRLIETRQKLAQCRTCSYLLCRGNIICAMAMSKNLARYFDYDKSMCIQTDASVILSEVSSRRQTRRFPVQRSFHRVVFSPYSRHMYLYQRQKQEIYHFQHEFSLEELNVTPAVLVAEVVHFIVRGHSIKDPKCTCRSHLSYSRHLDYGLDIRKVGGVHKDHGICVLGLVPQPCVSDKDICNELGIESLSLAVSEKQNHRNVHDILMSSGRFAKNTNGLWNLKEMEDVQCENTLLKFIRQHRLGLPVDHPHIQYSRLKIDIRKLVENGHIIHLKSENMLYMMPKVYRQEHCDADIVKLWRKFTPNASSA